MQLAETITPLVIYFFAIISTIYMHEAGHYITARLFRMPTNGFRIKFFFNILPVPTGVYVGEVNFINRKKMYIRYILVVANGILAGAIPLSIYLYYLDSITSSIVVSMLYLYMCSNDLSRFIKLLHGETPYEEVEITVSIPESEEECLSIYPNCEKCGYNMLKECEGNMSIFPDNFKLSDIERISTALKERYN